MGGWAFGAAADITSCNHNSRLNSISGRAVFAKRRRLGWLHSGAYQDCFLMLTFHGVGFILCIPFQHLATSKGWNFARSRPQFEFHNV